MRNLENLKKVGLVAVIVIALVVAFAAGRNALQGDQMVIEGGTKMPAGFKSEKERAIEDQKASGAEAPKPFDDTKKAGSLGG